MTGISNALARRIRRHVTGTPHRLFAVVHPGFEETAAEELRTLGIASTLELAEGGIEFEGKLDDICRINYLAATPTRMLMRLDTFRAEHFARLRAKLLDFPWELHLADRAHISFSITCRHSRLYHTGRIEQEARAAITQRLSPHGLSVMPPDDDPAEPASQVFVRFQDDICTVSLDSSGEPLYRRGYKTHVVDAPLRETLAACILRAARIDSCDMLIDPMCGSGTFSIEAAMIRAGRPAGEARAFAFESWPSFRPAAFAYMKKHARPRAGSGDVPRIVCGDIDERAVSAAASNAGRAELADLLAPVRLDFFAYVPDTSAPGSALLVLNPPYGGRMGSRASMAPLYAKIGEKVRSDYPGFRFAIIAPGVECEKALGLEYTRKILFMNGGIKVALLIRDAQN